jgi:uncharacterized protein (TIGR04168 family)
MSLPSSVNRPIKIAVIGDIHDAWDAEDPLALHHLGVDLVLFVGDLGNESVAVAGAIAALPLPKAIILGNHDAWYTATPWGAKKCPYDRSVEDRVQQQLDLFGPAHVGYSHLDFPQFGLAVVGARPFSWGGSDWKNTEFYQPRYGISTFAESTAAIVAAAQRTQANTLIFMGHCGPAGLGDRAEDICGKDWHPPGGDHGDPDFASALAQTKQLGKTIPLVTFGHMHHHLRHRKDRLRTPLCCDGDGTVYLNAARVPRIIKTERDCVRNFSLVTLEAGVVTHAALVWVNAAFERVAEEELWVSAH